MHLLAIGKDWWLPTNYAVHGRETDALFGWFFWITVAVWVAVEATLIAFVLRYRSRKGHTTARYIHGNRRLEMTWTLIASVILASLAIGSKRVWDDFRNSPNLDDSQRSTVLVIGQQFKWNVVYPGPDGKLGRYLIYPKPTDGNWPVGADGSPTTFAGVSGPALLLRKAAIDAINRYVAQENPLGKDFADPDGADDDWAKFPGRPIYVPVNRPVEVQLESEDVIHDFFLPNFRAQLYAVPGMRGRFTFTPTTTTAELEAASRATVHIDELPARLAKDANLVVDIDEQTPSANHDKTGWRYVDSLAKKKPTTIIRNGSAFAPGVVEKLKAAGVTTLTVHKPAPFEIVCAQLCGNGHSQMRGELIVLPQAEFDQRFPAAPHVAVEAKKED